MAFTLGVLMVTAGLASAQSSEDPNPDAPRWRETDYDLRITEDLRELLLTGDLRILAFESTPELERSCDGEECTADELRRAWDQFPSRRQAIVDGIEGSVEQEARAALDAVAGSSGAAEANATVNRSTLEEDPGGDPYKPPILVTVTGSTPLPLREAVDDTEQAKAVFAMGGRVNFPLDQTVPPGANRTLTLEIPDPLAILDSTQGDPSSDGTSIEWVRENWKGTTEATIQDELLLGRPDVVVPDEEQLDVDVVLDLSSIDVHYLQALTGGQVATLDVNLSVSATIESIETPRSFEGIVLPYLSADAMRIGRDTGLIPDQQLTSFEDEARASIRSALRDTLGEAPSVQGGFIVSTLERQAVGEPLGTGPPIRLEMSATGQMPIPPEQGQGASAFEITRIPAGQIQLPAIPTPGDRPAQVTVILPDGVDLAFDEVEGSNVTRTTTEDGRSAIVFTSGGGSEGATIQGAEIVVEHPIIWNLFWPLILFLLLVLVVLPAAIILYVRKQRRERRGVNQQRRSPVRGGYGDQHGSEEDADDDGGSEGPGSASSDRGG